MNSTESLPTQATNQGSKLQRGLREMLSGYVFTHWVTLNFHHERSAEAAKQSLQLWYMNLCGRLFRSHRYDGIKTADLLLFFAFPEDTRKQQPHFHLLVKVTPELHGSFEKLAAPGWKKLVPSGTADVQLIRETVDDHLNVHQYATKRSFRPDSYNEFIASTMLQDFRRQLPFDGKADPHTSRAGRSRKRAIRPHRAI